MEELSTAAPEADRLKRVHVIGKATSTTSGSSGPGWRGSGLDGQWSDDFHHALHALLTESGPALPGLRLLEHLARAFRELRYTGQYSLYGSGGFPPGPPDEGSRFVVYAQNHDQTGNRERSERSFPCFLRRAEAGCSYSAFVPSPLIFMGEEYGETAPFRYFTSFSDPELAVTVLKGRLEEFSAFGWQSGCTTPGRSRL